MATRPFSTDDESVDGVSTAGRISRYQMTVVAADLVDVVRWTGGWLCDRARAGWDVNVLLPGRHDARPLTILGATALDGDGDTLAMVRQASRGGALAVCAHLLATDERIRAEVLRIVTRDLTDVTVWGEEWPAQLGREVEPVQHRLSSAARAFKLHALGAAAASRGSVAATETLFHLGTESLRPLYSV